MRIRCSVAVLAPVLHHLHAAQVKTVAIQHAAEMELQTDRLGNQNTSSLPASLVDTAENGTRLAALDAEGAAVNATRRMVGAVEMVAPPGLGVSNASKLESSAPLAVKDVSKITHRSEAAGSGTVTALTDKSEGDGGATEQQHLSVKTAQTAACAMLIGVLSVFLFLRVMPAPKYGIESVHQSSIVVDSEFTTCAAMGRCFRAITLCYLTYFMYPGRVYTCFCRDPSTKKYPKTIFLIAPSILPLVAVFVCLKHVFKPNETLEKAGFQADSEEACEEERRRRGGLARFFHALFFYAAMFNQKVWAGSKSSTTSVLSKDHWRKILVAAGASVPAEVGRYTTNKDDKMAWKMDSLPDADIVVKPEAGCLGEASACFKRGVDYTTKDDIVKKMEEFVASEANNIQYSKVEDQGPQEWLLLERVMPDDRGVHLLEVCTAVDANGSVGVIWMTYFLDTNSFTSHQASSRYRVNADTFKIEGGEQWFRRRAMNDDLPHASKRFGEDVPGAKEACALAIKAHEEEIKGNPARKFLGWDCMFTKKDGPCFFEGNTMELRMGRSFYASWTTVWMILRTFSPPE
eukprot:TRINITY_DN31710_c0_g1_i1.p1 TRINITY_DN31710_c0_g1~~TRINITY_DN31710_c0_g1_i1.p1  ORF type:complete len:574 (+),score=138.07 TRINITY_DN31710_c0_g1_i1:95-1816(+)